jgi:hypothetical protein
MGIAVESVLASRHHALTDTLDTYHPQSRVERTMQWATGKFQFVNMLAPWTDFAKVNASLVAGSEILRAVQGGGEGKASARQLRTLGESGIEPHMADRIAKAFETGGEVRDGVHLPNTADWTDKEARRVFEGAVARDVDISGGHAGAGKAAVDVATRAVGDRPVQILHRGRDRAHPDLEPAAPRRAGAAGHDVLDGPRHAVLQAGSLTGGQPTSDKPQDWIKERSARHLSAGSRKATRWRPRPRAAASTSTA